LPAGAKSVSLKVSIAGRTFPAEYLRANLSKNQTVPFVWDGQDSFGRTLSGDVPVDVDLGYVYKASYQASPEFGYNGNGKVISGDRANAEVTLWRHWRGKLGNRVDVLNIGGWSLSPYHAYDPNSRTLYTGDGSERAAPPEFLASQVLRAVAGSGRNVEPGYGTGPVTQTNNIHNIDFAGMWKLGFLPDGRMLVSEMNPDRIWRVERDGSAKVILSGAGYYAFSPCDDGTIVYFDGDQNKLFRLNPNGSSDLLAGSGATCDSNTCVYPIAASSAKFTNWVADVACGKHGEVYLAERDAHRVLQLGADAVLRVIAGNGEISPSPAIEAGAATAAGIGYPDRIALDPSGNVLFYDTNLGLLRKIDGSGNLSTVLRFSSGLGAFAVSPDGTLYFYGSPGGAPIAVYRFGIDAKLQKLVATTKNSLGCQTAWIRYAGQTDPGPQDCGTGGLISAPNAGVEPIAALAVGPDGNIYSI
jgi:hypothetical protein